MYFEPESIRHSQSRAIHWSPTLFVSLAAVRASMLFLENVKPLLQRPVWINADILPGPNGGSKVVDAKAFLDTVTASFPDVTFSLGWTTGWHPEKVNEGGNSNQVLTVG